MRVRKLKERETTAGPEAGASVGADPVSQKRQQKLTSVFSQARYKRGTSDLPIVTA